MATSFKILMFIILYSLHIFSAIAAEPAKSTLVFSLGNASAPNACESPWTLVTDPGFDCSERSQVFRFAYNYNFTPTWGLEFSAGDISNSNGKGTSALLTADPYTWQLKTTGVTLAGIGNFRITNHFSLIGKVGVVRTVFKETIHWTSGGSNYYGAGIGGVPTTNYDKNSLTYGLGFQYNFNNDYGIRVQYENFGKFDLYSEYNLSALGVPTPDPINFSVVSAGFVILY